MAQLASLILLAALVVSVHCYDDIYVRDLPPETAAELKLLIEEVFPPLEESCAGHPVVRKAEFLLYNRDNPTTPIVLGGNNLGLINPKKDVKVLIHGWLSSASSSGIIKLKDAYLKRYDCNLISVNWTKQAFQPYSKAHCDVPGIGHAVSQFLCTVSRQLDMSLGTTHVLGHSLGGQVAGYTGQYVLIRCNQKIGRITGLDPAGPLFEYLDKDKRLDSTDAEFVDVIHTDSESTGISRNSGDADFYSHCGQLQPGCPYIYDVLSSTSVSDAICSSLRSVEYMVESISSNHFIAGSCGLCPAMCRLDIGEEYSVMGEECRNPSASKFYITTNSRPPYAQGWGPYPKVFWAETLEKNQEIN